MKTRLLTNLEGLQSEHINVDLIVKKTIAYAQSGTYIIMIFLVYFYRIQNNGDG